MHFLPLHSELLDFASLELDLTVLDLDAMLEDDVSLLLETTELELAFGTARIG